MDGPRHYVRRQPTGAPPSRQETGTELNADHAQSPGVRSGMDSPGPTLSLLHDGPSVDPRHGSGSIAPHVTELSLFVAADNPTGLSTSMSGVPGGSASGSPGADGGSSVPNNTAAAPIPPHTCLQKGVTKPVNYKQITKFGLACSTCEQSTLEEALSDTWWKKAMEEEHMALRKNKTWHQVPPQQAKHLIDCRWVFRMKRKSNGTIDCYKARLFAKGFKQRYRIYRL